jgi:replicative DNA helicase
MLWPDAVATACEALTPEAFYGAHHELIFGAVLSLFDAGEPVDLVSVVGKCRASRRAPDTIGVLCAEIQDECTSGANTRHYAEIVLRHYRARELMARSHQAIDAVLSGEDVDEILGRHAQAVTELAVPRGGRKLTPIKSLLGDYLGVLEKRHKTRGQVHGVRTGFCDLDAQLGGMGGGDLVILAARPSMGKTALALQIAMQASCDVAMFSLEMSSRQVVDRMASISSRVDLKALRSGWFDRKRFGDLSGFIDTYRDKGIAIDDTGQISVTEIRAKSRRYALMHGIDLIIVDYLQIMRGNNPRNREREIAEISSGLKGLAKELDVPVVALSQLNRGVESRTDKRPMLSDLRESGAIEQDADSVLLLYRDEYYNGSKSTDKGVAEVSVAKNRNGPTGIVKLAWQGQCARFADLDQRRVA